MSLDVSLYRKLYLSYDKGVTYVEKDELVYDANITHNLGEMADKAGIYEALWRPEEIGKTKAGEIIHILESGLIALKLKPDYYKTFDSPNGWGLYKHFVPFVEGYLNACREFPDSDIVVSR